MSIDYGQTALKARALLKKFGVLFTFTREGEGAFDPVSSILTPGDPQTFTAYGIIKMLSPATNRAVQAWQDSGLVGRGDEMLLVDAVNYVPALEDRVSINSQAWAVKAATPLRPGVSVVLNYLLIRKV